VKKKPVEIYDDPAAFREAVAGKKPKQAQRARNARPDIPRAPAGEGDRLAALRRLARLGWMPRWRAGAGFDFWRIDGRSTSAHSDYVAAVQAAEDESKG
jgi:hypothetical protein